MSLDETLGELGFGNSELRDLIEMHAELPDLWDLAHGAWEDCSGPSRFKDEAAQQELVAGIRQLTPRPVVGVGRFTSPDVMVRQVKSGTLDLIGCARPSIADPYLPRKIDEGREVTLLTPATYVSQWSDNTLEQAAIHARLVELGVDIVLNRALSRIEQGRVSSECVFSGQAGSMQADAVVMVASRVGNDALWQALGARENEWQGKGIKSIKLIGDAQSPAPIAWATYAGHRYARELDNPDIGDALPFRREVAQLRDD